MHRFTSGGGWVGQTLFPEHNSGGGGTTASPNLWRFNGVELIMVTAPYRREVGGGIDIRLLAFTPDGALVADQRATSIVPETTGGFGKPPICAVPVITLFCYVGVDFTPPSGLKMPPPPLPGVGLHTNPLGGTPWILVSDHHKDFVGFTFSLADHKFYEVFRVHDENRFMRSAPSFIPDQHSIIGVEDTDRDNDGAQTGNEKGGVVFSGPNQAKAAPLTGLPAIYASATRMWDGRTALVGANGELILLNGRQVTARVKLAGDSIVPAAASRTHVFVSTQFAFQTFDPASLTEVANVTWNSGGKSPPVIGPQGHVYVTADQTLFVFGRPIIRAMRMAEPAAVRSWSAVAACSKTLELRRHRQHRKRRPTSRRSPPTAIACSRARSWTATIAARATTARSRRRSAPRTDSPTPTTSTSTARR